MTVTALGAAARDVRGAWSPRATLSVAAFAVAALAPLVVGETRVVDVANGLYLAAAAVALALVVGIAGQPLLAQGAFVAVGATIAAHLVTNGMPTAVAALAGAAGASVGGAVVALAFARLPPAGFAAATWIVSWLFALAAQSVGWLLGGAEGIALSGGPTPTEHYELALALTALAALAFLALARSPFGLSLAAAREREAAARELHVRVVRLRVLAVTAAAAVAGLTGALAVQLAGVGDPASYGPYLSFKLFVVVLLGGALAPLGAPVGVLLLGVLSVAASALGSLENVAASRSHALLAAVMLLGVVSLGWSGVLRPVRGRRPGGGTLPGRPAPAGLVARGVGKRYSDLVAAASVDVAAAPGTITALVGPNGSGKTTVLRLLSGSVEPDEGRIETDALVTRTPQATRVFPTLTPLEHVLVGSARRRCRGGFFRTLLSTPKARAEDAAFVAEARTVLRRFALPEDTPAGELPAGDQRALMLAAAYATGAPVLLVDEPTAGASPGEAARIVSLLQELREEALALVVVEHNLAAVRRLADRVVVLDAGRVIAAGTPADVAVNERVREAYLGRHTM